MLYRFASVPQRMFIIFVKTCQIKIPAGFLKKTNATVSLKMHLLQKIIIAMNDNYKCSILLNCHCLHGLYAQILFCHVRPLLRQLTDKLVPILHERILSRVGTLVPTCSQPKHRHLKLTPCNHKVLELFMAQ